MGETLDYIEAGYYGGYLDEDGACIGDEMEEEFECQTCKDRTDDLAKWSFLSFHTDGEDKEIYICEDCLAKIKSKLFKILKV